MRKEKFIYNTQTLRYEKVEEPLKVKILRIFGFVSAVAVAAFVLISVVLTYFPSPKEKALMREIEQMKHVYSALGSDIKDMSKVLNNLQERDASVHRTMFGMDPVDTDVWNGGIGGHDKYSNLTKYKNSSSLLISTSEQVSKLKRQMIIQSKSLDTIVNLAQDREQMFSSIPSIKPVRSDRLNRKMRLMSGFGMRLHPIHKVRRMHAGLDFSAKKGTPIQVTGDGKVVAVKKLRTGYGRHIIVDHGYGYKTLYAHMDEMEVKKGQKVKKGQVIGTVGNTGTSTAPHLHYEVRYKDKAVNPIHYCMDGLSPEQYQEMVNVSSIANQSFD